MPHLEGTDRNAKINLSLEELIEEDNPVRVVDQLIESLDLEALGFQNVVAAKEGRPAYPPGAMLKLYVYGYLNKIRSSRKLALECRRNLEVRWLIAGLMPCYHSIADFRKVHAKALEAVFKTFTGFLGQAQLVGGEVLAIDGSKFRAVNSKKNNYNQNKLERHLAYIHAKIQHYQQQLEVEDCLQEREALRQGLQKHKERKRYYEQLQQQVQASPDGQVSTVDSESRALILHRNIVEVAYNVQAAVDEKHKLIVHLKATNRNDAKALASLAKAAKTTLGVEILTVLADKGYHNGEQLRSCQQDNITTLVAYREFVERAVGPTPEYYLDKFVYHKEQDHYTCPQGHPLKSNGNWYKKYHPHGHYLIKRYWTVACQTCWVKHLCTDRTYGRNIDRSEYQDAVEDNNQRVDQQPELYRKRQAIVEHPFGTIKRGWGYSYTLLKGVQKVNGEMALIFLCYNLRRSVSLLGLTSLLEQLKKGKLATLLVLWWKTRANSRFCTLLFGTIVENDFSLEAA